jgi:hypothetical protein
MGRSSSSPRALLRCRKLATWVVDDREDGAASPASTYGVASNRPGVMLDAIREEE